MVDHTNIRKILELVNEGQYEKAFQTIASAQNELAKFVHDRFADVADTNNNLAETMMKSIDDQTYNAEQIREAAITTARNALKEAEGVLEPHELADALRLAAMIVCPEDLRR